MIQRIQTIYLLAVTALLAVTLFAPLAWFAGGVALPSETPDLAAVSVPAVVPGAAAPAPTAPDPAAESSAPATAGPTAPEASVKYTLYAFALQSEGMPVQSTTYLGVLLALACALPLATIFLFRNRMLQIRLCAAESVLLLGAAVMEGVYYFLSWRIFSEQAFHTQGFHVAIALPLVGLFFVWLAIRAIFRDEILVRAADRIR